MNTLGFTGTSPKRGSVQNRNADILALNSTPLPSLFRLLTSDVEPVKVREAILRCESRGSPVFPGLPTQQTLQKVFPRTAIRTHQARIAACAILRSLLSDRRFINQIRAIRSKRRPAQSEFALSL
jgi:hypothetical protein